ncbi:hypothetical protein GCM10022217_41210 [Chryseobacterium ginsenosidimutans]|uniref:tetratricopeptide repeat protein n=1 Tax=Chryseobacterium ginsenosidimutans TaxID=687846 RepID=UPI0031D9D65E
MIRIFMLVFIVLFLFGNGQEPSYPEIDSALSKDNYSLRVKGKFDDAIALNKKLIRKSETLNYTKGIAWGYINIGNILCTRNNYEESLKYLGLAEAELKKINEDYLKTLLYAEYGREYNALALFQLSNENYDKAIILNKNVINKSRRDKLFHYIYASKVKNFEAFNQSDSIYANLQKAYHIIPAPITAANIANYYLERKKNADSAAYYLAAATHTLETKTFPLFDKMVVYMNYGEFYTVQKQYDKALDAYFKAIDISKKIKRVHDTRSLYHSIADAYNAMNDEKKAKEYLYKYTYLNDSLSQVEKDAVNISVDKFIKDKNQEKEMLKTDTYYVLGFIIFFVLVLIIAGCIFYKKKKKEKEVLLQIKQETIERGEVENKELKQKVNTAFDEVIQLAKQNDPAFLARFQEVYPEVYYKLIELNPKLVNTELILCAMIWLNFSSKDIAQYIFVQPKTVQVKKQRLRKKLGIPLNEDIYLFLKKI